MSGVSDARSELELVSAPDNATSHAVVTPASPTVATTPTSPTVPFYSYAFALLVAAAAGGLGTIQTVFNNRAGKQYGTFFMGTTISFAGGVAVLLLGVIIEMQRKSLPFWRWTRRPQWQHCIPGALGVAFVSCAVALTSVLGFTLFFIAAVLGQLLASCLLDHNGWLQTKHTAMTRQRWLGIVCTVLGAALASIERIVASDRDASSGATVGCFALAVAAGTLMPVQAALNRSASELLPSKLQTTLLSFSVGLATSIVATVMHAVLDERIAAHWNEAFATSKWWMYCGGPLGAIYIASGIWFVQVIGSATFFVSLVCGQMTGSVAIDATGFLGTPHQAPTALRMFGILLVVAAAAILQFRWQDIRARCRRRFEALDESNP